MKLDSTDSLSIAGGEINNGQTNVSVSKEREYPNDKDWSYMFVHHTKVEQVADIIRERFNIFIHKTTSFVKTKAKVVKKEKPTISGLIFIQGLSKEIKKFLQEELPDNYLVNDCSTGTTARIKDSEMQFFIQTTQVEPTRIRFLEKPYDYYGKLYPQVQITSGPFAGMEGVVLRIHRDRNFVVRFGNMTIAISGIHNETFKNTNEEKASEN